MKRIIICLIALVSAVSYAQHLQKGYHGSVDVGYFTLSSQLEVNASVVSTTHGYQFTPYVFLGGGVAFEMTGKIISDDNIGYHDYQRRESKTDIPIYLNGRFNFTKTRFSPFADIRWGVVANDETYSYAVISLGCRYALNDMMGLHLLVGYEGRDISVDEYHVLHDGGYYKKEKSTISGLVVRFGFDF